MQIKYHKKLKQLLKATLHIQTLFRNNISTIQNCYFTAPLKIMNITEDKRGKDLHLMLMSSSPGILDEDEVEIRIDVGENCSFQLHTQSYQRLFNMQNGATQIMQVCLQNAASFTYLPHPSVPHQNSIFITNSKIYLDNNCKLIWGEILTCGRKLNKEIFKFSKYHSTTEIFLKNKLILKENLLMQPSFINPNLMGKMEGYTHQASFIYYDEIMHIKSLSDKLYDNLLTETEIDFGITSPSINLLSIRILGLRAEQLYNCLKRIAGIIAASNK